MNVLSSKLNDFIKSNTIYNIIRYIDLEGKIGFVPQLSTPPYGFSVLDIVLMGTSKHKSVFETINNENIKSANYWLGRVGMQHL